MCVGCEGVDAEDAPAYFAWVLAGGQGECMKSWLDASNEKADRKRTLERTSSSSSSSPAATSWTRQVRPRKNTSVDDSRARNRSLPSCWTALVPGGELKPPPEEWWKHRDTLMLCFLCNPESIANDKAGSITSIMDSEASDSSPWTTAPRTTKPTEPLNRPKSPDIVFDIDPRDCWDMI